MDRECSACKWWESFNWICCNGDSENCADITDPDVVCPEWEPEVER